MHTEPWNLFIKLKTQYPDFFYKQKVLEAGSLDINGSIRKFFTSCWYTGVDVGPGIGVDLVSPIHEVKAPGEFDVVVSTEMLEHDKNWKLSIQQMYDNLKSEGLLVLTCAGPTRKEHGYGENHPEDSPFTTDYYENRTIEDLRSVWQEEMFSVSECYYLRYDADLLFWGIKK